MACPRVRTALKLPLVRPRIANHTTRSRIHRLLRLQSVDSKLRDGVKERGSDASSSQQIPPQTHSSTSGLRYALTLPAHLYGRSQAKRPYLTQLASALLVFAVGDLAAQYIEKGTAEDNPPNASIVKDNPSSMGGTGLDLGRLSRTAFIGVFMAIPGYHWMLFLGNNFNMKSKPISVLVKILINQFTYSPFIAAYFFSMQSLLSGQDIKSTWQRVVETVPKTWLNSWTFWPFVMGANFAFIQPQNRSIFAISAGIIWQTYLCIVNQQQARKAAQRQTSSPIVT